MPALNTESTIFAKGYTSPSIRATLLDADGEPYDIPEDSEIAFRMVSMSAKTRKVDDAAAVLEQIDGDEATTGRVRYDWEAEDVDTVGGYWFYFIVTPPGGAAELFPVDQSKILRIVENY